MDVISWIDSVLVEVRKKRLVADPSILARVNFSTRLIIFNPNDAIEFACLQDHKARHLNPKHAIEKIGYYA